ncbi:fimbrial protein [Enterobacter hormaechei]
MKASISALRRSLLLTGALAVLLNSAPGMAKGLRDAGDKIELHIHIAGTVTADGSCTFVNGGNLEVPFGDIHYNTENGVAQLDKTYTQTLDDTLTCTGDVGGDVTLSMTTVSDTVDYQGHKLIPVKIGGKASQDLAIQLLVDGQVQDINKPFPVSITTPPSLQAELVQSGDGKGLVNDANISASATLTLAFL